MKYRSLLILIIISLFSCGKKYSAEEEKYIKEILSERAETNEYYKTNPKSPFIFKGKVEFHELNYFEVDPGYRFTSKLYEYPQMDTIKIYGSKGDERTTIRYGYVVINYKETDHKLNVYQGKSKAGNTYYSIWFTDKTTNFESYGVGRYLDFDKEDNPDHIYTIDFNKAYNPYCAYSSNYSCAVPTKEDYLDMAIKAGEKKFHD